MNDRLQPKHAAAVVGIASAAEVAAQLMLDQTLVSLAAFGSVVGLGILGLRMRKQREAAAKETLPPHVDAPLVDVLPEADVAAPAPDPAQTPVPQIAPPLPPIVIDLDGVHARVDDLTRLLRMREDERSSDARQQRAELAEVAAGLRAIEADVGAMDAGLDERSQAVATRLQTLDHALDALRLTLTRRLDALPDGHEDAAALARIGAATEGIATRLRAIETATRTVDETLAALGSGGSALARRIEEVDARLAAIGQQVRSDLDALARRPDATPALHERFSRLDADLDAARASLAGIDTRIAVDAGKWRVLDEIGARLDALAGRPDGTRDLQATLARMDARGEGDAQRWSVVRGDIQRGFDGLGNDIEALDDRSAMRADAVESSITSSVARVQSEIRDASSATARTLGALLAEGRKDDLAARQDDRAAADEAFAAQARSLGALLENVEALARASHAGFERVDPSPFLDAIHETRREVKTGSREAMDADAAAHGKLREAIAGVDARLASIPRAIEHEGAQALARADAIGAQLEALREALERSRASIEQEVRDADPTPSLRDIGAAIDAWGADLARETRKLHDGKLHPKLDGLREEMREGIDGASRRVHDDLSLLAEGVDQLGEAVQGIAADTRAVDATRDVARRVGSVGDAVEASHRDILSGIHALDAGVDTSGRQIIGRLDEIATHLRTLGADTRDAEAFRSLSSRLDGWAADLARCLHAADPAPLAARLEALSVQLDHAPLRAKLDALSADVGAARAALDAHRQDAPLPDDRALDATRAVSTRLDDLSERLDPAPLRAKLDALSADVGATRAALDAHAKNLAIPDERVFEATRALSARLDDLTARLDPAPLRSKLDALAANVGATRASLDAQRKDPPLPDDRALDATRALSSRVDDLASRLDHAPLRSKLDALAESVGATRAALDAQRQNIPLPDDRALDATRALSSRVDDLAARLDPAPFREKLDALDAKVGATRAALDAHAQNLALPDDRAMDAVRALSARVGDLAARLDPAPLRSKLDALAGEIGDAKADLHAIATRTPQPDDRAVIATRALAERMDDLAARLDPSPLRSKLDALALQLGAPIRQDDRALDATRALSARVDDLATRLDPSALRVKLDALAAQVEAATLGLQAQVRDAATVPDDRALEATRALEARVESLGHRIDASAAALQAQVRDAARPDDRAEEATRALAARVDDLAARLDPASLRVKLDALAAQVDSASAGLRAEVRGATQPDDRALDAVRALWDRVDDLASRLDHAPLRARFEAISTQMDAATARLVSEVQRAAEPDDRALDAVRGMGARVDALARQIEATGSEWRSQLQETARPDDRALDATLALAARLDALQAQVGRIGEDDGRIDAILDPLDALASRLLASQRTDVEDVRSRLDELSSHVAEVARRVSAPAPSPPDLRPALASIRASVEALARDTYAERASVQRQWDASRAELASAVARVAARVDERPHEMARDLATWSSRFEERFAARLDEMEARFASARPASSDAEAREREARLDARLSAMEASMVAMMDALAAVAERVSTLPRSIREPALRDEHARVDPEAALRAAMAE